ncbi:MAG: FAD-dependent monooxygenase [Flavobacteriales bacterium]|jgi:2-polyprenyl-6-methoxyphenol hydroxylase-like FAD-dependent oxidoreductase
MAEKKKIAIIGGGIAGLTFALSLKSEEYECHIFEKKESFGEIGAAISVFPNALSVMDELGLYSNILKTAGELKKILIKTSKGTTLGYSEPKGEYPVICIHRADLHRVLLNHTSAKLFENHGLKSIAETHDHKLRLVFENGKSDLFDAVIGADGIHSEVRKYLINDGLPFFRGYNIWRGVVKTNFDIGHGSETLGKGQRVGIVPIKEGVYGWWATCNEEFMQDDEPEGTRVKLKRLFGDWHHPIPSLIEETEVILKNSLSDRIPTKGWSKNNVVLIGDAAHPTTPNLGQGGCTAIEGAYLLSKCIDKYGLTEKAYNRYEELHFDRAKQINLESLRLGKIGQLSNPLAIFLRNLLFYITPSRISVKLLSKYFNRRVTKLKI